MKRAAPMLTIEAVMADVDGFRRLVGASIADIKRAERLCRERPRCRCDFLMALACVDAGSFALHVKGDRAAWNEQMAASRIDIIYRDIDFSAFARPDGSRLCP